MTIPLTQGWRHEKPAGGWALKLSHMRRRLGPVDAALVVTTALMFTTNQTVLFFHVIFVLLTLGAFSWRFTEFAIRAGFWVTLTTAEVLLVVLAGGTQPDELIEIPLLSTILILVFMIARRRAEAQALLLEQDQAFLEAVLENMEDGVVACDADGNLAFLNRATRLFHGLPASPPSLDHWSDYYGLYEADGKTSVPDQDLPLLCALRGEPVRDREISIAPKGGEARFILASGKRMTGGSGQTLGAVVVMRDITERKRSEERLRHSLDALIALHEASQILGSTLEFEEIGQRLLEIVQRVSNLDAAVINLQDDHPEMRVWHTIGSASIWSWARSTPAAQAARRSALDTEQYQLFELRSSGPDTPRMVGLCLPLRVRDRVIGLLETYGSPALAEKQTVEILQSLASNAATALENAGLYRALAERERRLHELVGQMLVAQEEERRRIAYDVHDGLAQVAVAAHQHLQTFALHYRPRAARTREELDRALDLVRQTVGEARQIIADLRPTALDDFGLASAIRLQVEALRAEGWQVSFDVGLGEERLPVALETALYRITQEALTNARKHAQSTQVRIKLERCGEAIRLRVQDWGCGFQPDALSSGDAPGARVGLSGMKERVALLGGHLDIQSRSGKGTSIVVEIPLPAPAEEESASDSEEWYVAS